MNRRLKKALQEARLSYAGLAAVIGVSKAAVVRMVQEDHFPAGRQAELRAAIEATIAGQGIRLPLDLWPTTQVSVEADPDEEVRMRVQLSMEARQRFGLPRDPFEVTQAADVWYGRRWRYAATAMEDAAQSGGLLAVVGESGTGKSTLRRAMIDRLRREEAPVRVIEPLTVDRKRLTASAICAAIIDDLAPTETPRSDLEFRTRQVKRVLTESSRSGCAHVVLIEEAHDLHYSTLRHLKRLWEMEDGFKRLLAVLLLAQPEIMSVLDSRSWATREVVRRIEIVELGALDEPGELESFLDARLDPGGDLFDAAAFDELRGVLSRQTRSGRASIAWPLSTIGLVTRALNLAAELEQDRVTAETVRAAAAGS